MTRDLRDAFLFWALRPTAAWTSLSEGLVLCAVDEVGVRVLSDPEIEYTLEAITGLEIEVHAYLYLKLKVAMMFRGERTPRFLFLIDPVKPSSINGIGNRSESKAFVEVVNSLKMGRPIALERNPYHRRLRSLGHPIKPGELWDARVSPLEYERLRNRPKLWHFLLLGAVFVLFMLVMAALNGGITIQFQ